ncbi:hypothetical protein [Geomesophilobacter sediminis]|uniref:Uncharacterized protein n=1 Tax=Geomesophilobacter sediminis TaxID=2798584 RepID=A0A8J7JFQ2_9BACT|nr:hypothetical protein [Geomesophilobacter sediminis]MBJ6726411.1 hypothetical protein [Geomesophilobacter sediminis]
MERVREQIRIATIFTPGRQIKPVWFDWHNRKHSILRTTYFWREKVGDALLLHFSVTDGEALYELVYNTKDQSWLLNGIEVK